MIKAYIITKKPSEAKWPTLFQVLPKVGDIIEGTKFEKAKVYKRVHCYRTNQHKDEIEAYIYLYVKESIWL